MLMLKSILISRWIRRICDESEEYVGVMLPNSLAAVCTITGVLMADRKPAVMNFTAGIPANRHAVQIANIKNPIPGNTEIESDPIWVRARAFSGETYPLVEAPAAAGDWVKQGEWWYYQKPLLAGELTSPITFEITGIPEKDAEDHMYTSFNVAVVYESTLVHYNEDGSIVGNAMTNKNWTRFLDTSGQP